LTQQQYNDSKKATTYRSSGGSSSNKSTGSSSNSRNALTSNTGTLSAVANSIIRFYSGRVNTEQGKEIARNAVLKLYNSNGISDGEAQTLFNKLGL
jgi:hypothetical protein